jgi:hypothetical protein
MHANEPEFDSHKGGPRGSLPRRSSDTNGSSRPSLIMCHAGVRSRFGDGDGSFWDRWLVGSSRPAFDYPERLRRERHKDRERDKERDKDKDKPSADAPTISASASSESAPPQPPAPGGGEGGGGEGEAGSSSSSLVLPDPSDVRVRDDRARAGFKRFTAQGDPAANPRHDRPYAERHQQYACE